MATETVKYVFGWEFDNEEQVSPLTTVVLHQLQEGAAYIELDDGDEAYQCRQELQALSDKYGYFDVLCRDDGHKLFVIDRDKVRVAQ